MKIRRYATGQTNVDMLEQQVRAIRSPEEVARAAYAPYGAAAEAAGKISKDLQYLVQEEERLAKEEAAQTAKIAAMKQQVVYNTIVSDPKYKNQMQADGTPTAKAMLDAYEEASKATVESLSSITDQRLRQQYGEVLSMQQEADRVAMRAEVNKRRDAWNAMGEYDLFSVMVDGGQYEDARNQLESMRSQQIVSEAEYRTLEGVLNAEKYDQESEKILTDWELARASGKDDEFYERLVNDDTLDPDLKQLAIRKIETQQENLERITMKKRGELSANFAMRRTDIKLAMAEGRPLPESVETLINDMLATNDPVIQVRAAEFKLDLYGDMLSGAKVSEAYSEYQYDRQIMGQVLDTKQNREFVDQEIQAGLNPDMTPEQVFQHEVGVMREAGILSQKYYKLFSVAENSPELLARAAPAWKAIMMNDDPVLGGIRTDLDKDSIARLTAAADAIDAGADPIAISQEMYEIGKNWQIREQRMEGYKDIWTANDFSTEVGKQFDDFIDDVFDASAIPFYGQGEFPGFDDEGTEVSRQAAQQVFRNYAYDAFMNTGNITASIDAAMIRFKDRYRLTNINGFWEIQEFGRSGDHADRRTQFAEEAKGQQFYLNTGVGGFTASGQVTDPDELYFTNAKVEGGKHLYEVYYRGRPLMKKEVANDGTVSYQQVYDQMDASEYGSAEIRKINEETQAEIRKLESKLASAKYSFDPAAPLYAEAGYKRSDIEDIPQKIRHIQSQAKRRKEEIMRRTGAPEF